LPALDTQRENRGTTAGAAHSPRTPTRTVPAVRSRPLRSAGREIAAPTHPQVQLQPNRRSRRTPSPPSGPPG